MNLPFLAGMSPFVVLGAAFLLGACTGTLLSSWIVRLTAGLRWARAAGAPDGGGAPWRSYVPLAGYALTRGRLRRGGETDGGWALFTEAGTGLLFAVLVGSMVYLGGQATAEVRPDEFWRYGRIAYHLALVALLVAATGTDFREYVIPDAITVPGTLFGVGLAVVAGDLQIIHLWVDWNREDPIHGPYIPQWIKNHPHWHGLAWSLAGVAAGAGVTWIVRAVASLLLGREAMGFGDVTLMAMIGSFVGWQPVCCIFLLAPLCGLVVALGVRVLTGRSYVPFGPYLSLAAFVVLCTWRWLWMPTRQVFGHAPSLALVGGVALGALVLLLGLLRLYRAIPVTRRGAAEAGAREDGESG